MLLFWKQNANICIKTSKQLIYTVLFRDVSFLFNVFFFVFYWSAPRVSTMMTGSAPYPMPPFPPHVQQHPVRMPYPPPDDLMYTARSQQSEAYRHVYSGVTPRPYPESRPVDIRPDVMDPSMYKPWPSEPPPQPYYEGFAANGIPRSPDMRYMSPHMSHPLEGHHFSPNVSRMSESYYATAPLSQSPDGRFMPFQVPRPPDVPNVHSSGDAGKHFQRRPDLNYHGREGAMISPPQAPANMRPEGEGGVYPPYPPQRHAGIPYPPPPVNVDLGSYFNFLAAQGFPVPYPVPYPIQSGQTPPQVDTQNKDATQDRENDGILTDHHRLIRISGRLLKYNAIRYYLTL